MIKNKTVSALFVALCMALFSAPANAGVVTLDLNDFFADPTVTVAPDGLSALMEEDPTFPTVLLVNDPGLGDPNIIIPSAGAMLIFDYAFTEGAGNDDEFFAAVLDDFGFPVFGFDFLTGVSGAGSVSFDLSALVGQTLGLLFQLDSFDDLFDSTLEIRNLRIETDDVVLPLPPVTGLLFMGLIWLNIIRRARKVSA